MHLLKKNSIVEQFITKGIDDSWAANSLVIGKYIRDKIKFLNIY